MIGTGRAGALFIAALHFFNDEAIRLRAQCSIGLCDQLAGFFTVPFRRQQFVWQLRVFEQNATILMNEQGAGNEGVLITVFSIFVICGGLVGVGKTAQQALIGV